MLIDILGPRLRVRQHSSNLCSWRFFNGLIPLVFSSADFISFYFSPFLRNLLSCSLSPSFSLSLALSLTGAEFILWNLTHVNLIFLSYSFSRAPRVTTNERAKVLTFSSLLLVHLSDSMEFQFVLMPIEGSFASIMLKSDAITRLGFITDRVTEQQRQSECTCFRFDCKHVPHCRSIDAIFMRVTRSRN